jgi:hypothetical protein
MPPHPGSWHGWTYAGIHSFISGLPSPSSIGLVVLSDDRATTEIGLAAYVLNGHLRRVTTLEGLPPLPQPSLDQSFVSAFCGALERAMAPAAAALVCTRGAFDAWLYADQAKPIALRQALTRGEAILHNAL